MNRVKLDIQKGLLDTQTIISEQFLIFIIIVMGSLITSVVFDLVLITVISEGTAINLGSSLLTLLLSLLSVFSMWFWVFLIMQFFKQSPEESIVTKISQSVINSLKMGVALFIFMTPIMFVSAVISFIGMSVGLESLFRPLFTIVMFVSSLMMIMLSASMTYNKGIVVNIKNSIAIVRCNFIWLLVIYLTVVVLSNVLSLSWMSASVAAVAQPILSSVIGIVNAVLMLTLFNQSIENTTKIEEII